MEHIAALLLIIGCSQDLKQCQEIPAPIPVYETVEECDGDLPVAIGMFTGQRPRIFAQCVTVDPALEEADAELVWDIRPDGTLNATLDAPQMMIASTSSRTAADTVGQQ
ncbi:MAG: hypothetical protein H0T56_06470 [Pseudaminobacter sp.]|nr:hypothetical protein [Pseudaminobacter sp.]